MIRSQLSYADLTQQIEALNLEFKRLKAAEGVFHRQNESLKALHDTSLSLIEKLDKEELLENILERAASLSDTSPRLHLSPGTRRTNGCV